MTRHLLRATGLKKAFPGALALDAVDFDLRPGEIHALVGKNGAGKSTLISIISGIAAADAGHVRFDDRPVALDALGELPVAAVYQESATFPDLTVAENIFAGNEPRGRLRTVDRTIERERTALRLREFGVDADPDCLVSSLSPAERKVVEIIRSLEKRCRILILDEPTAALSPVETGRLFALLRQAKATGIAVIYISHRLEEIFQIADRVTVMRDGRIVLVSEVAALDLRRLVAAIVGDESDPGAELALATRTGRSSADRFVESPVRFATEMLRHAGGRFGDVSLAVRKGEIVGLGGLVGAGKTELGKALFGAEPIASGAILLDGARVHPSSPAEAIADGIVYVTEDRKHEGLFLDMPIADNICAPILERFGNALDMLDDGAMRRQAARATESFHVKASGVDQVVATLSGGNQQKVLLARWLQLQPSLLIVDEPTVGVDVAAREDIYRLLRGVAAAGTGVIFISSELTELMRNTDRIVTMYEGRITGSFLASTVTEAQLLEAISGTGAPQ